jgi:hypothetical protein
MSSIAPVTLLSSSYATVTFFDSPGAKVIVAGEMEQDVIDGFPLAFATPAPTSGSPMAITTGAMFFVRFSLDFSITITRQPWIAFVRVAGKFKRYTQGSTKFLPTT